MFLIRVGAIDGYERLVSSLGANPVRLLKQVGFSSSQLRDPNTYVSYTRLAELLEITASEVGEPMFGLLLTRYQNSTVLGDVAITIAQQPTVRQALETMNRYLYLHARGVRVVDRIDGDIVEIALEFEISSRYGLDQLRQLSVGQLEKFLVELLCLDEPGRAFVPTLRQRGCAPEATRLDPQFLAGIRFGAVADGARFPSRWLEREAHRDQESVRRHFQDFMQTLQQRYPDSLQDQVRDIIGQLLPSGECSTENVAATLGLHPRVLQKRLQQEGCSYSRLLRETRMALAEQHLSRRTMSVTDLALHLGYAEVSVFSRHFKNWTGCSPSRWSSRSAGN